MRILIAAVSLAVLAGCTTPSDLLASKPEYTHFSTKAPKEIALCVYPAWQDYRPTAVMNETSNGFRIVAGTDMGQTDDVLDIVWSDERSGSVVKSYQRAAWSQLGRGGLTAALNRCL